MNPYSSLCDDFGFHLSLNTKLPLPTSRETILHFFEALQKIFPSLTDFECRDSGEFVLEENRERGSYRWVMLEQRRLCSGYANPPDLKTADDFHLQVLEIAPFHLDITRLDCEALDLLFTFDFVFSGNHDEVVVEALGLNSPLEGLVQLPGIRVINYEPSLMLALDESCRLQCRLGIETRTNAFQVRTGQFPELPISVFFTIRQYWTRSGFKTFAEAYQQQRGILQELVDNHIIPGVIRPLAQTIAAKQ
ncbi:MAG: hypothetical protein NZ700_00105 [Gemmataceae bacterium]|nr:hypothetical protein [Gemmataceae bacterium]MDW8265114.1 hypothetical protein [Gemmataceae bacterium]